MNSGKVAQAPSGVTTTELYGLFKEYANRPFVFVEPGGNGGDYLIYKGAEKLGRMVGIDFRSIAHEEFMRETYRPDTVIYVHGSGGINPLWSGTPMIELGKAVNHEGVVILGPSTYWDDLNFLQERIVQPIESARCERLVLMARERVSYDLMMQVIPAGIDFLLDHDTALNLDRSDLENLLQEYRREAYTLYGIREDKEAGTPVQRSYFSVWRDPVQRGQTFMDWLRLHADAREIVTNRLHSSICGSILDIPTTLLPNNYFKNRAVWEHSLSHRGVKWEGQVAVGRVSTAIGGIAPLRRFMTRGKVRNLVHRLRGAK